MRLWKKINCIMLICIISIISIFSMIYAGDMAEGSTQVGGTTYNPTIVSVGSYRFTFFDAKGSVVHGPIEVFPKGCEKGNTVLKKMPNNLYPWTDERKVNLQLTTNNTIKYCSNANMVGLYAEHWWVDDKMNPTKTQVDFANWAIANNDLNEPLKGLLQEIGVYDGAINEVHDEVSFKSWLESVDIGTGLTPFIICEPTWLVMKKGTYGTNNLHNDSVWKKVRDKKGWENYL